MIDASKAPNGAERYNKANDVFLKRVDGSLLFYNKVAIPNEWEPLETSYRAACFIWDSSEPIHTDSTPEEEEALAKVPEIGRSKYHVEIKPGVWVDVYDVLQAYSVTNSALAHLIKKALKPGERGHKDLTEDLEDIVASAKRALELEVNNG